MGSTLARAVSDNWGHLPAGPYKVLMRMALRSLDTPNGDRPAATYWHGWIDLAQSLDRKLPDTEDMSPEATRKRKTIRDEISRHCTTLQRLGAVERLVDSPGRGTRQVWKLATPKAYES